MKLLLGVKFGFLIVDSPTIDSIDFLFIEVFLIDFFSFKLHGFHFFVKISLEFFFSLDLSLSFGIFNFLNRNSVFKSFHKVLVFGVSDTFYFTSSRDLYGEIIL